MNGKKCLAQMGNRYNLNHLSRACHTGFAQDGRKFLYADVSAKC